MSNHYYDHQGNARHDATKKQVREENLLISVTTYLAALNKPGLNIWKESQNLEIAHEIMSKHSISLLDLKTAVKNAFEAKNNAAAIGTAVHKVLEMMIKEQPKPNVEREFFLTYADELAKPLFIATSKAYQWHKSICTGIGNLEETVVNVEENYAGQLDFFGALKDPKGVVLPGIIDWKTQKIKHPGFLKANPSKHRKAQISKYDTWQMQMGAYAKVKRAMHGYIGVISSNPEFPHFEAIPFDGKEIVEGYKNFVKIKDVYRYMNKL